MKKEKDILKKNYAKQRNMKGKMISLGSNFIAGIGLLSFLGYKLDEYVGNKKYLYTLLGMFLGFFWGMYETYKIVVFSNKEENKNRIDQ